MSNHVIIKGKNDRLVIALNPDIDFLDICDILKTKILEAKSFIGNSRMAIEFSGRTLTNEEENILIGKYDSNVDEIDNAIYNAGLSKDISLFTNGLDTLVGERGVSISGGQKQRISLARAFLKEPDILILDDSLSAVDSKTQMAIIQNIRNIRKEKSTIIVSHRLSLVSHAHEIIVMDEGEIAERGNHENLMKQNGWYATQYQTQQLKEDEND